MKHFVVVHSRYLNDIAASILVRLPEGIRSAHTSYSIADVLLSHSRSWEEYKVIAFFSPDRLPHYILSAAEAVYTPMGDGLFKIEKNRVTAERGVLKENDPFYKAVMNMRGFHQSLDVNQWQ